MTIRRWLATQFFTPIQVEFTIPPADVIPGALTLADTPASAAIEREARDSAIRRLVHRTLLAESLKDPGLRNAALTDFCLEARSILQPSAPGSEVLREVPPAGIRYPAPVIPGRAA